MFKSAFCIAVCIVALSLSNSEAAVDTHNGILVDVRVNGNNSKIQMPCSLVEYTDGDGAQGCPVSKYDKVVTIANPTFPVIVDGNTYTAAHHKAYWDWVYTGFGAGGSPDWGKNCHGYAFDVGDWPSFSNTIINGTTPCWVQDFSNATIADNGGHSAIIQVVDCPWVQPAERWHLSFQAARKNESMKLVRSPYMANAFS